MKLTFMGTGTSHGVPVIGCKCRVCTSPDLRDVRFRSSVFIQSDEADVVVDTGPEFRLQAVKYGIQKLDSVFITHSHADHLNGLDDLRIFSHTKAVDPFSNKVDETEGEGLPIYADRKTLLDIINRFDYIFKPVKEGGGKPKLNLMNCSVYNEKNPVTVKDLKVYPVPLVHGSLCDTGWLFVQEKNGRKSSIAYLTDCNEIPLKSFEMIKNIAGNPDVLVIDGLREKAHTTHFSFWQAMEAADKICARNTYITHITHDNFYIEIFSYIQENIKFFENLKEIKSRGGNVAPAFDGLVVEV